MSPKPNKESALASDAGEPCATRASRTNKEMPVEVRVRTAEGTRLRDFTAITKALPVAAVRQVKGTAAKKILKLAGQQLGALTMNVAREGRPTRRSRVRWPSRWWSETSGGMPAAAR